MQYSFDLILTSKGRIGVLILGELILILMILRSIFGMVIITISPSHLMYFNGLFNIGWQISFPLDEIQNVFVRTFKYSGHSGGDGAAGPNSSESFIIIRTKKDTKILKNVRTKKGLDEICQTMKDEIQKYSSQHGL